MNKVVIVLRYSLILFFLYAIGLKLFAFDAFVGNLNNSILLSDEKITYLKYAIPLLECIAVLLLFQYKRKIGFYFSFFLLLVFTFYLIALNDFSFKQGCSCGGIFNKLSYPEHLSVNILFLLFSLLGVFLDKKATIREE